MLTQGTPVPPRFPGLGQIPSAQTTRGIQPEAASSASGRAGNSLPEEQYQAIRAKIDGLPDASASDKLVLYKVVDDLDVMSLSDNTPLTPEQRSVIQATVRNASDNVKAFAEQIVNGLTSSSPASEGASAAGTQPAEQEGMGPVMMSYAPQSKGLFQRIMDALAMIFTGKTPASDNNQIITRPLSSFDPVGASFSGGQPASGTQGAGQGNGTVTTAVSSNYPLPTGDFYEKSPHHDPNKFVPRFPMIAYHESGVMREQADPYAVGAISNPSRGEDLGGKTYGVYQFESSTYADGSTSRDSSQSTLARFVNSPNNPYGEQLRAAAQTHGLGSAGFDQVWKQLSTADNKAFGEAQEGFMLQETEGKAVEFFNRAGLSEDIRNDPAMLDLVLGTINQVGGLATDAADHLKSVAASRGRPLTGAEASQELIQFKMSKIPGWFQSSPDAQQGVRNRYEAELIAMNGQYRSQDPGTMMA